MKIAVIGSGISGLGAAHFLSKKHKVDLFEKENYFGGHSYTVEIPTNNSNNRELGLDLPPNRKDLKSNLIYSLLTFSGTRPAIGDKIYATTPTVSAKTGATSLIRGKLIGIVQARNLLSGTQVDVLISTTNRELFTTSATVFVVNGTT